MEERRKQNALQLCLRKGKIRQGIICHREKTQITRTHEKQGVVVKGIKENVGQG